MNPFNWTCPFCDRPQTVGQHNYSQDSGHFYTGAAIEKSFSYKTRAIRCQNPECDKTSITFQIHQTRSDQASRAMGAKLREWRLVPESAARVYPDYVPSPLRQDYEEACKIAALSPKASATLARRCIQGAIHDFCNISARTLFDEVVELKKRVDEGTAPAGVTEESVEAIHHVRKLGNIGAHMEHDINLIVDVDPGEALALIAIVELIFEEWYVSRHKRQERLKQIGAIRRDKDRIIAEGKPLKSDQVG